MSGTADSYKKAHLTIGGINYYRTQQSFVNKVKMAYTTIDTHLHAFSHIFECNDGSVLYIKLLSYSL